MIPGSLVVSQEPSGLTHAIPSKGADVLFGRRTIENIHRVFLIFGRQLFSPEDGGSSGGAGEAIEIVGKLQDRFSRAGISQLPGHFSRLPKTSFDIDGIGPPSCIRPDGLSAVYWEMQVL